MDYFLARYYSSAQGRFTSCDEFVGGPDDLFDFADNASANPTLYANPRNPQSLNKYQYCYNNPLRYIDPDGHDPLESDPQQQSTGSIPVPPPPLTIPPDQAEALTRKVLEADAAVKGYMQSLPWFEAIREWGPFRKVREWIGTEPAPLPQTTVEPQTTTLAPTQQQSQPQAPPPPLLTASKDTKKVIKGLLRTAETHLGKVQSSGPNDPNRNHWKKEAEAALKRAQNLVRRLKGKAQERIKEKISDIQKQLD